MLTKTKLAYKNILIVEDDRDDSFYLLDALAQSRLADRLERVDVAENLTTALEYLAVAKYDFCIFDYNLGSENGVDLLALIREEGFTTPVLFLTGNEGTPDLREQAYNLGAVDLWSKQDFSLEELYDLVEKTIFSEGGK